MRDEMFVIYWLFIIFMLSLWRVGVQNAYSNLRYSLTNRVKILKIVSKMPFYAVANGRSNGVYNSWSECENQVKGFSGARYKKFDTLAGAQDFIAGYGGGGGSSIAATSKSKFVQNTSNYNLKRSYTTSNSNQSKYDNKLAKGKSKPRRNPSESDDYDQYSDDSDDLNTMICKQMDDIEERLKGFEKGVDKIYKKTGVKKSRSAIMIEPPMPKKSCQTSGKFEMDDNGFVQVYTDGSCTSNGRTGAKAGLGVYWGDNHPLNKSEPVSGRATNNCGEIQAATAAIKQALDKGVTKLAVNTDSQFLINSVTKWMPGWKRKGWKLSSGEPVKNERDFKDLDSVQHKLQIKWNYVEAHRGIQGNEMADQLAKAGASMYKK